MSHVSKLKAAVTDLVCLENAANHIGMDFDRHATQFRNYGGRMTKCEGKLSVRGNKDAYEMGVEKNKDGTYGLLWDSYAGAGGLVDVVGKGATKLLDEYQASLFTKHMSAKGMRVRRTTKEDGTLLMVAE